jgi:hypothetical protein
MAHEADCLDTQHYGSVWADRLLRFAILVAAAEREECAKLAEQTVCDTHLPTGVKIYGTKAAAAIRVRGQA